MAQPQVDVQVVGDKRLAATLHVAAVRVQDMSRPASRTAALIAAAGRSSAPRLTGRLASSLAASSSRDHATVQSGLAYAARTHWGYRRYAQAPQPFLADPAHATEPVWTGYYVDQVDLVLAAVKGA